MNTIEQARAPGSSSSYNNLLIVVNKPKELEVKMIHDLFCLSGAKTSQNDSWIVLAPGYKPKTTGIYYIIPSNLDLPVNV